MRAPGHASLSAEAGRFPRADRASASRKRPWPRRCKLGRKARTPAREIMILSIALSHPALIESHCEELAATEFIGAGVGALRDALLAAPAEALISSTALAEWLTGAGRGPDCERILALAAKMPNWWCMRPRSRAFGRRSGVKAKLGLASSGGRVK